MSNEDRKGLNPAHVHSPSCGCTPPLLSDMIEHAGLELSRREFVKGMAVAGQFLGRRGVGIHAHGPAGGQNHRFGMEDDDVPAGPVHGLQGGLHHRAAEGLDVRARPRHPEPEGHRRAPPRRDAALLRGRSDHDGRGSCRRRH